MAYYNILQKKTYYFSTIWPISSYLLLLLLRPRLHLHPPVLCTIHLKSIIYNVHNLLEYFLNKICITHT